MMSSRSLGSVRAPPNQFSRTTVEQGKWSEMIHRSALICLYSWIQSLAARFPHATIKEVDIVKIAQMVCAEDILQVHEFTAVIDRRELPETVGFVFEITGDIGMVLPLIQQSIYDTYAAS